MQLGYQAKLWERDSFSWQKIQSGYGHTRTATEEGNSPSLIYFVNSSIHLLVAPLCHSTFPQVLDPNLISLAFTITPAVTISLAASHPLFSHVHPHLFFLSTFTTQVRHPLYKYGFPLFSLNSYRNVNLKFLTHVYCVHSAHCGESSKYLN